MIKLPRTGFPVPNYQFDYQFGHKMMKLPITGDSMSKYQFAPELVMLASKLYHKMMKLPGYLIPKLQFGTKLLPIALKI